MDVITPSDIAYIISMIKNSAHLWLLKREDTREETNNDHVTLKPLFTARQKKKRTFGTTMFDSPVTGLTRHYLGINDRLAL